MGIKKNDTVNIMSFKHNGSIHRVWDSARVIEVDEEKIVVCTEKTRVEEATKRVWYTKEPAILYFFYQKWYNVIAMLRKDGVYYYTNISSPCIFDNGCIKYIDYDLDLKTFRNGKYKIMDINEFYCHKYSMGYSKKVERVVLDTIDHVVDLYKEAVFPFSDEIALSYYENVKND
ncbi:MAG: DUF402 domain-containing protein [Bacilli bacterium]